MQFPDIHSAADPEDYCWEVELHEGQELRQIDDQHAAVYYEDEHIGMTIAAEQAHDADGSSVPTTLAVTGEDIVTLTVHHLEGNPAVGGASFVYPIIAGEGWEGGFESHEIEGPPDEAALRKVVPAPPFESAAGVCLVPNLIGKSVQASRTILQKRGCHLGPVHGSRSKSAHVVRQYRQAGKSLPAGTEVGIKLGA